MISFVITVMEIPFKGKYSGLENGQLLEGKENQYGIAKFRFG